MGKSPLNTQALLKRAEMLASLFDVHSIGSLRNDQEAARIVRDLAACVSRMDHALRNIRTYPDFVAPETLGLNIRAAVDVALTAPQSPSGACMCLPEQCRDLPCRREGRCAFAPDSPTSTPVDERWVSRGPSKEGEAK
jgi:hypothetical protein